MFNAITHIIRNNGVERGLFRKIHIIHNHIEHILIDMSNRVEHQKQNQPSRKK